MAVERSEVDVHTITSSTIGHYSQKKENGYVSTWLIV